MEHLQWMDAPQWANRTEYIQNDDALLENLINRNRKKILEHVHAGFSAQVSDARGFYFIGRQSFAWSSVAPGQVWIDTEICHYRDEPPSLGWMVRRRYLLPLLWDPATHTAQVMLGEPRERQSPITQLQLKQLSPTLREVEEFDGVTEADMQLLEQGWDQIMEGVLYEAEGLANSESAPGGEFDDGSWPDRIEMTGAYSLQISKVEEGRYFLGMYFRSQPEMENQPFPNYMCIELEVHHREDGSWTTEVSTTRVE